MSRLCVAPIVEGHGEDNSIRVLLQRIWAELLGGEHLEVLKPIRCSRGKLLKQDELGRAVELAMLKLRSAVIQDSPMVLILLDADADLPCALGPSLLKIAQERRTDADISCVVANVEYETWFAAACASLEEYLDLSRGSLPEEPERERLGKAWIQKRFRGIKYSETVDQPAMTSRMDLAACRQRSPSFDKLCRELEKRR